MTQVLLQGLHSARTILVLGLGVPAAPASPHRRLAPGTLDARRRRRLGAAAPLAGFPAAAARTPAGFQVGV
jgi:hypothetical protein